MACCWKSIYQELKKAGMWLLGALLWKIIKSLVACQVLKFVFIDKGSWNSECPELWYALVFELTSYTKYTDTKAGAISNHFESLQKFQGRSAFWFSYKDKLKIKFLKILFFSNTDIHRFLWVYSLIKCLQINRTYVTSS